MSWLRRLVRAGAERLAGRYYEGPAAPPRLAEEVRIFAIRNPTAGPADWEAFAVRLVGNAYRDGWVRGFEVRERAPASVERGEDFAEHDPRHDWSLWEGHPTTAEVLRRGYDPNDPLAGIPPEHHAEVLRQLGEAAGTFRVVVPGEPAHLSMANRFAIDEDEDDEQGG